MKKQSFSKAIRRYVKELKSRYETLKAGPAHFQVDFGRKATQL